MKNKGSISYYVISIILILGLVTTGIIKINIENSILNRNIKNKINENNLQLYQIKNEISESIMYNDKTDIDIRDISVKITKITDKDIEKEDRNINKSSDNIKIFFPEENINTKLSELNNYFIFSLSELGYSIGYTENQKEYDIGFKNNKFYFAIEELENKELYIDKKDENEKHPLFIISYIDDSTNFYVAEFEFMNEIHYVLYQENHLSITELIDVTK